jgi:uncharacterized membrane protein YedE/YeeE
MLKGLLGGALIGVAATVYWLVAAKPAGISGIVAGAIMERDERDRRVPFLAGLIIAGLVAALLVGTPAGAPSPPTVLVLGGLLVGFGTRLGGGCTSGHGVCGLARFSPASAVAVAIFVATGAATVALVRVLGVVP